MTSGLLLMKHVLTPLAKSVLIPLGLSGGMSATNAAIQKKIFGSLRPLDLAWCPTALIIPNEEIWRNIRYNENS